MRALNRLPTSPHLNIPLKGEETGLEATRHDRAKFLFHKSSDDYLNR